ncbi:hypothetical protein IQ22_00942 [Pseudomonas duriflava]|uniref:Uncharacterized protein n=1 Tax=Pseudomonas duriflava TaxID=459528 RepID=A0A562QIJ4_9PSED|nr:hypothetical protein IQ22_00942 [Pseudomonas duriflava]
MGTEHIRSTRRMLSAAMTLGLTYTLTIAFMSMVDASVNTPTALPQAA